MTTTERAGKQPSLAVASGRKFVDTTKGRWTIRIVTLVVLLTVWQVGTQNLNRAVAAPPTEILVAFWQQLFVTGSIWLPLVQSLGVLFGGLAIALVIGIPIGVAMGRSKTLSYLLDPYVTFLYALPHVALVPLMIILLGFDWPFRLTYVVFASVWLVLINTMVGVSTVDTAYTDVSIAYTASERQIIRHVIFPAAAPYIVAGGRQAFSVAVAAVVISEILSNLAGLGGQIQLFAVQYLTANMFVSIVLIMLIAVATQATTAWLQRKLTPWQLS